MFSRINREPDTKVTEGRKTRRLGNVMMRICEVPLKRQGEREKRRVFNRLCEACSVFVEGRSVPNRNLSSKGAEFVD